MKVLIVRLSSIGDVVHTLPLAAALAGRGWTTGWVAEPASFPLLAANRAVARAIVMPPAKAFRIRAALGALGDLREDRYNIALDLQGLWKSACWARLSGARRVLGFDRPWRREPASALLLGEAVQMPNSAVHVIDKNLALLKPLGIEAVGSRDFPLPAEPSIAADVERRLGETGLGSYIVLNAGGGWPSKLWPAEGFGAVARALGSRGLRSLVTWGPGEEGLADRVVEASGGLALRCFATTLLELVEVLRRAQLVLAADTGPLHLACAVGTPVVGLYGPTDPQRNGPFAAQDRVVRRVPPCAPCHRRRCDVHDGVMLAIPPEDVVAAIDSRLAQGRGGRSLAV